MELVKPGIYINFMRHSRVLMGLSLAIVAVSIVLIFFPGLNYGLDFTGGTEIQLGFKGKVTAKELRSALKDMGYDRPEVFSVQDRPNEYIIRVVEISSLSNNRIKQVRQNLHAALPGVAVKEFKLSPGRDKISLRLSGAVEPSALIEAVQRAGIKVRSAAAFGASADNRYEVRLTGLADEMVKQLQGRFKARAPDAPRRVEWVGPKAGAQLRTAALQSMLYAIAFIMVYVAFRFDLRFAPGGVLAMIHDAVVTLGIFAVLRKEVNLSTVAAVLTVMGYSVNDTIVIFDRVRENMQRMRDKSLGELINISMSQTLSRTIITSLTVGLSMAAFFYWGTPVIRDFAFAMMVGLFLGTWSTIYIAMPFTEWMDRRFFRASDARSRK
ncbi:MAG: protein translocase subunit SecF [Myxococcales bacterium]|nr:protein translocase subunit SecF [Myxococcales bacterium]MCB9708150.1 protein translocase subunit SecF [Myxococcales bacterium]